jgi:MFS transporter, CP family, cyanate transporter
MSPGTAVPARDARRLLLAMFLASLALRPQVVGVGPLLSAVGSGLHVSHSVAGLLSTLIVLCMGLLARPAYLAVRGLGLRWTIAGSLGLIAAFGLARALAPPAAGVIGLTLGVGIGIAVAQSVMPLAVRESWPQRPVFATGVYTAGINGGGAVAAAVAVPLARALGGWRGTLSAFSLFTAALLLFWLGLTRHRDPHVRTREQLPPLPLRNSTGWLLVAMFATNSIVYYGLNAWLPSALTEHGWSRGSAGLTLTVINGVSVLASLWLASFGDRVGSRRMWLSVGCCLALTGLVGVTLLPAAGWLWAALLGACVGTMFTSMMMLPLDAADRPDDVGAMAAMMLTGGYTLAALAPFVLGGLRDAAGSFSLALWFLVGDACVMLAIARSLTPARLARHRRGIQARPSRAVSPAGTSRKSGSVRSTSSGPAGE